MVREDAQCQEIGRFFHENRVAGAGEERTDHIQRVRDAVGHEQAIGIDRKAVLPAQKFCQRDTEIPMALFRTILQEARVVLCEAGTGSALQ